jgi:hypothetical protein
VGGGDKPSPFRLVPSGTAWCRIFFFKSQKSMQKVDQKLWITLGGPNRLWVLPDGHCAGICREMPLGIESSNAHHQTPNIEWNDANRTIPPCGTAANGNQITA